MNSVMIIGDKDLSIAKLESLKFEGCISKNRYRDSLVLEYANGRVYFDYSDDIILDYEEEDLHNIDIVNPKFISLSYSSKEVLKNVILSLNPINNLSVDDDNGTILSYKEYISTLR